MYLIQEERSKNEEPNPMIGPIGEGWNVGYVAGEELADRANICSIHLYEGLFLFGLITK